jgi:hypothetical protein
MKRFVPVLIASFLTFLITRLALAFLAGDFAYSVIPGWHTIIYPPEMTLTVLTLILLSLTLSIAGLFKLMTKLILIIFKRVTKDQRANNISSLKNIK